MRYDGFRLAALEFGLLSRPRVRAATMADQSAKADALVAQAKKRLASWLNLTSNKYEDAAELFAKAANLYKASKKCASVLSLAPLSTGRRALAFSPRPFAARLSPPRLSIRSAREPQPLQTLTVFPPSVHVVGDEAGATFEEVARQHIKLNSAHEAATAYTDAANCYKKTNAQQARHSLRSSGHERRRRTPMQGALVTICAAPPLTPP